MLNRSKRVRGLNLRKSLIAGVFMVLLTAAPPSMAYWVTMHNLDSAIRPRITGLQQSSVAHDGGSFVSTTALRHE